MEIHNFRKTEKNGKQYYFLNGKRTKKVWYEVQELYCDSFDCISTKTINGGVTQFKTGRIYRRPKN